MAGEPISSISDLFGLNSPRGLLNVGNSQSNGLCTPPASSLYFQVRYLNYIFMLEVYNNSF